MKLPYPFAHSRGQAFMEFAMCSSLLLVTYCTILSMERYAVLNERSQTALRYQALVGQQQDPYTAASLNSLYQALNGNAASVTCENPDLGIIDGSTKLFTGDQSPAFLRPIHSPIPSCTPSSAIFKIYINSTNRSIYVRDFNYTITTQENDFPMSKISLPINQTVHAFTSSYVSDILQCYGAFGTAIASSLKPSTSSTPSAVIPLTDTLVKTEELTMSVQAQKCQAVPSSQPPPTVTITPAPAGNVGTKPTGGGGGGGGGGGSDSSGSGSNSGNTTNPGQNPGSGKTTTPPATSKPPTSAPPATHPPTTPSPTHSSGPNATPPPAVNGGGQGIL